MRKFLLFGTMLGVASAALAFGGMFNHGNKSTTYKGGVDAIGVHFGGEKKTADSEPKEETCPAEKQCGDYCCQGDNVCKQDPDSGEYQCCSDYLHVCCPTNQTATLWNFPRCCSETPYCRGRDAEGNCTVLFWECCAEGYVIEGDFVFSDGTRPYECCENADDRLYLIDDSSKNRGCCSKEKEIVCVNYEDDVCTSSICCDKNDNIYCASRHNNGCDNSGWRCCSGSVTTKSGFEPDICTPAE